MPHQQGLILYLVRLATRICLSIVDMQCWSSRSWQPEHLRRASVFAFPRAARQDLACVSCVLTQRHEADVRGLALTWKGLVPTGRRRHREPLKMLTADRQEWPRCEGCRLKTRARRSCRSLGGRSWKVRSHRLALRNPGVGSKDFILNFETCWRARRHHALQIKHP